MHTLAHSFSNIYVPGCPVWWDVCFLMFYYILAFSCLLVDYRGTKMISLFIVSLQASSRRTAAWDPLPSAITELWVYQRFHFSPHLASTSVDQMCTYTVPQQTYMGTCVCQLPWPTSDIVNASFFGGYLQLLQLQHTLTDIFTHPLSGSPPWSPPSPLHWPFATYWHLQNSSEASEHVAFIQFYETRINIS